MNCPSVIQVMIAEKASDMIREKNTVKPIQEYFKHLIATKHKKFVEDEDEHHQHQRDVHHHEQLHHQAEHDDDDEKPAKKYKNKKH